MKIPSIVGTIDRRILINYQAEKEIIERFLPNPFRPKLVKDKAIVGICLIRLKNIRPQWFPINFGIASENGAHRIAVEWNEGNEQREGVFVPRRDTSSKINALAGGRVFPGVHHLAKFKVKEAEPHYSVEFTSDDNTYLSISAVESNDWNKSSVFESLESASHFFKQGSVGYSPAKISETFDGLELRTKNWHVTPLTVTHVASSFFENKQIFPEGSISFDNALLMKGIDHEWKSQGDLVR